MGRRLEVEKKERYAQELREQMRERRARQEAASAAELQAQGTPKRRQFPRAASAPSTLQGCATGCSPGSGLVSFPGNSGGGPACSFGGAWGSDGHGTGSDNSGACGTVDCGYGGGCDGGGGGGHGGGVHSSGACGGGGCGACGSAGPCCGSGGAGGAYGVSACAGGTCGGSRAVAPAASGGATGSADGTWGTSAVSQLAASLQVRRSAEGWVGAASASAHSPSPQPSFRRPLLSELSEEQAVADKVAQLQDLVRARLKAFEDEQEQRWSHVERSLANKASAIRAAGDESMLRQLDDGLASMRQELRDFTASSAQELRTELSNLRGALQQQHGHIGGLRGLLKEQQSELQSVRDECFDAMSKKSESTQEELESMQGEVVRLSVGMQGQVADLHRLREELRNVGEKAGSQAGQTPTNADVEEMLRGRLEALRADVHEQVSALRHDLGERLQPQFESIHSRVALGSPSKWQQHLASQQHPQHQASGSQPSMHSPAVSPQRPQSLQPPRPEQAECDDVIADVAALRAVLASLEAASAAQGRHIDGHGSELALLRGGLQKSEQFHGEMARVSEDFGDSLLGLQTGFERTSARLEEVRVEAMRSIVKLAFRIEMFAPEKNGGGGGLRALLLPS